MDGAAAWVIANFGGLVFPAAFFLVAIWEGFQPARVETTPVSLRWFGHIVLLGLTWALVALLPFLTGFGSAVIAQRQGWGLFNILAVPAAAAIPLSFVALDVFGYWEHRLLHALPLLWRLHALHHSDPDLDVTTTVRHHPIEVLVQMMFDAALAIAFGFPPAALALYATVVLVIQTIHHGNVELPKGLRWIGTVIITPNLHRVHHSMAFDENNSNFSNLLTIWDRLFGTFRIRARDGLRLGLPDLSSVEHQQLSKLIVAPWLVVPAQQEPSRTG